MPPKFKPTFNVNQSSKMFVFRQIIQALPLGPQTCEKDNRFYHLLKQNLGYTKMTNSFFDLDPEISVRNFCNTSQ